MNLPPLFLAIALAALPLAAQSWGSDLNPDFTRLAAAPPEQRDIAFEGYTKAISARRDAGQVSFTDAARLKERAARALYPSDTDLHELMSFVVMASSRFDAGSITREEYDYVTAQKLREYHDSRAALAAQQDAAAYAELQLRLQEIDRRSQDRRALFDHMGDRISRSIGGQPSTFCRTIPNGYGGYQTLCQ